jgi:hypothetical protein
MQFTFSSRGGDSTVTLWWHWVNDYTSRGLTYDKDKLAQTPESYTTTARLLANCQHSTVTDYSILY